MSKELESTPESSRPSVSSTGIYKRTQGRITRQATFGAVVLLVAAGCWSLWYTMLETDERIRAAIVAVVMLVGIFGAFRLVNMPRFADFLINVETEMTKVSWPTKTELVRTSGVVMVVIFGMTGVLFGYDFVLKELFQFIGVLPSFGPEDVKSLPK
jgi:preprotein translocase subunit SecE